MAVTSGIWKWCPRCKQHLEPLEDFQIDKSRKDGLCVHCRKCRRGYRLQRKPIPDIVLRVGTDRPSRSSIPVEQWSFFDSLCEAGVPVTIEKPDGSTVDWSVLA